MFTSSKIYFCFNLNNVYLSPLAACPAESKFNSQLEHLFTWSKTPAGQTVRLPCPCNSTIDLASEVYATRSCSDVGVWGTADSSGCSEATVQDLCEVCSRCLQASVCFRNQCGVTNITEGQVYNYILL